MTHPSIPLSKRVLAFLGYLYIQFVYYTSRWTFVGMEIPKQYIEEERAFVAAFWHSQLSMLPKMWVFPQKDFHMLISNHRDGQLIAKTTSFFGLHTIAGSTNRGGTEALRTIVKVLKKGSVVGITPDGPRGPARVASIGVAAIGQLAKVPIVIATFATSRHIKLKTWDRFYLPLPFSRGVFMFGDFIAPPASNSKEDMEFCRSRIESALNQLQDAADQWIEK